MYKLKKKKIAIACAAFRVVIWHKIKKKDQNGVRIGN